MGGFFTKQETQSVKRPNGKTLSCNSCGLYRKVLSPKMQPYGNFKKSIMCIGEAPGETEDKRGKPWQGKAGRLLKQTYKKLGVDLFDDCISLNAVTCRPIDKEGRNRTPTQFEVDCCRRVVINAIERYKPKVIILLGGIPLQSIIGHRWKEALGGITKWRGWTIPDQNLKCWVCPTLHPSYVMRMENNAGIEKVWKEDLKRAFEMVDIPFPEYKEPEIVVLENDITPLNNIEGHTTITIDYETTGLKPHAPHHRIVTTSVAVSEDKVYVFEMPKKAVERKPFVRLLKNRTIKKMGHNIKFEHSWSKNVLKTTVQNWWWDSMLAAHTIDNRTGITGLKFQVYVNFGIVDYNSTVERVLQAPTSNEFNRVREFIKTPKGKAEMLKYNALDSIFAYRLAVKQQKQMGML